MTLSSCFSWRKIIYRHIDIFSLHRDVGPSRGSLPQISSVRLGVEPLSRSKVDTLVSPWAYIITSLHQRIVVKPWWVDSHPVLSFNHGMTHIFVYLFIYYNKISKTNILVTNYNGLQVVSRVTLDLTSHHDTYHKLLIIQCECFELTIHNLSKMMLDPLTIYKECRTCFLVSQFNCTMFGHSHLFKWTTPFRS